MEFTPNFSSFPKSFDRIKYRHCYIKTFCNPKTPIFDKAHFHDTYEIYINISGNVSFLVGDVLFSVEPYDVFIIPKKKFHHIIYNGPTMHEYDCFWVLFDKNSAFPELINSGDFSVKFSPSEEVAKEIREFLRNFHQQGNTEESVELQNLINKIINEKSDKKVKTAVIPGSLEKIIKHIDENYLTVNSISDLAEQCYLSVPTLNRLFKKYINTTPANFLKNKKLAYAKELLENGATVTDACLQSGFSNCSHFISIFKETYGITPNKCKKKT